MAFRPKFYAGATLVDIKQALTPRLTQDVDGVQWKKIFSDGTFIQYVGDPEVHVPNEHAAGDTAVAAANDQHAVHAHQ